MSRSLGFGSLSSYLTPFSDLFSLRLHLYGLSLHEKRSCWPIMQKVKGHPLIKDFHRLKAKGFKFFSHSFGFFSPFPHGTRSLSNHKKGLRFVGGPTVFRQNLTCSVLLKNIKFFNPTGFSPSMTEVS